MSGVKRGARWLEVLVIAGIILLLVGVALPPQPYLYKQMEAEIKRNMHDIQLAVEKYGVDHYGGYPAYLVGGEARWSPVTQAAYRQEPVDDALACPELRRVADPLLREGYLTAYPRNPFARQEADIHQAQLSLTLNAPGGDPLRNGADTGRLYGTRFGAYCTSMGQLLGAKYYYAKEVALPYRQVIYTGVGTMVNRGLPPGADVTYPCWDTWKSTKARNPLPGEFIYAGLGHTIEIDNAAAGNHDPNLPIETLVYVLAAFGRAETKGQDIMDGSGVPFLIKPTESGVPLGGAVQYSNPDGIRDGIMFVLIGGVDY
jgi:hypothetical protein